MINKIFALPVNETISPVISRRQLDDLELIVIDHPQVKASVALQGAHLLSWKPAGEEEVLWLSNNTPFKQGVALRGGVPICWPWFGPSAQQGLPSHGFARNLPWTLEGHDEDDSGVMLTFALQHSAETMKLWPHEFTLYARFKLGKTCEIELEAHGEFETTSALHSYFNVGDIAAVKVSGLGERYIDKVNNAEEGVLSNGVQTFPDRTDRVYLIFTHFCFQSFVYTHCNICRLLINCSDNCTCICIKAIFATGITDFSYSISYDFLDINISTCSDLTHYKYKTCCS